jgi:NADH-quinone oxidoreductase subunit L
LFVLALLTLIGGFNFFAGRFLVIPREREMAVLVPALALLAMLAGAGIAIFVYRGCTTDPISVRALRKKLYVDEFYAWLIDNTQELLARISAFIDRWLIDVGIIRGASGGTWGFGALLRLMQVGNLQAYAFIFGLGIIWVIYFAVFR